MWQGFFAILAVFFFLSIFMVLVSVVGNAQDRRGKRSGGKTSVGMLPWFLGENKGHSSFDLGSDDGNCWDDGGDCGGGGDGGGGE